MKFNIFRCKYSILEVCPLVLRRKYHTPCGKWLNGGRIPGCILSVGAIHPECILNGGTVPQFNLILSLNLYIRNFHNKQSVNINICIFRNAGTFYKEMHFPFPLLSYVEVSQVSSNSSSKFVLMICRSLLS